MSKDIIIRCFICGKRVKIKKIDDNIVDGEFLCDDCLELYKYYHDNLFA